MRSKGGLGPAPQAPGLPGRGSLTRRRGRCRLSPSKPGSRKQITFGPGQHQPVAWRRLVAVQQGRPANGNPASAGGAAACRGSGEGRGRPAPRRRTRPVPVLPSRRKRAGQGMRIPPCALLQPTLPRRGRPQACGQAPSCIADSDRVAAAGGAGARAALDLGIRRVRRAAGGAVIQDVYVSRAHAGRPCPRREPTRHAPSCIPRRRRPPLAIQLPYSFFPRGRRADLQAGPIGAAPLVALSSPPRLRSPQVFRAGVDAWCRATRCGHPAACCPDVLCCKTGAIGA